MSGLRAGSSQYEIFWIVGQRDQIVDLMLLEFESL